MFCCTIRVLAWQHKLKLTTVTFRANVSVYFTHHQDLLKHTFFAGIPGKRSGREQPFRAYFFDAWEFFPQTLPVVTGPRRLPPHSTMVLSLGEASACQWHSKTRSSYLNLFFLDNVLEQNIHISLAGFSGGLGWLFTVINSLMTDFICSYPWKCWTIIAELFLFLWSCYWETINLTVFFWLVPFPDIPSTFIE